MRSEGVAVPVVQTTGTFLKVLLASFATHQLDAMQ